MKNRFCFLVLLFLLFTGNLVAGEAVKNNSAGAGNPLLPGYFADPTIVKFDDIYYIYATTDNEMLASGAPTLWYSKDLQNWYNYTMDIPSLSSINLRNYWAPDIIKGDNGLYYLYFGNCQAGCNIYGYYSESPTGPWTKLHKDDKPVIPNGYPVRGFPSLDAQFFRDDDGKIYSYWGTWVHYNKGYAVGQLDNKSMSEMKESVNIPLSQTPEPFEAAYMLKRNGKYILMYSGASCHDETYNVRYSYSDNPYGPFKPGANNPILATNEDGSVHGPGHHSVLKNNNDYYIVYHRHDYPFTRGGMSRQVCIDSLIFENDSTIRKVIPSHKGIVNFIKSDTPEDLAFGAKTLSSSSYHLKSLQYDYMYQSSYAVDNNNATMWKAGDNTFPQHLTIDLGRVKKVGRIATQFEFASYYYMYKIEYSKDGKAWSVYADKSSNRTAGSPMLDDKYVSARYFKLTILGTEKTGLMAAVWNIKIYEDIYDLPLMLKNKPSSEGPGAVTKKEMLVEFDVKNISEKDGASIIPNTGTLGGIFTMNGEVSVGKDENGIKAVKFVKGELLLDKAVPERLAWNGSFTVATWVKNPTVEKEGECLASWCNRRIHGLANSYNALFYNSSGHGAMAHLDGHFDMRYKKLPSENQWHHIVVTFDGVVEKVYVNGILDNSQNMTLASAIERAKIRIGASDSREYFSGFMSSLRMYDYALTDAQLIKLMNETRVN